MTHRTVTQVDFLGTASLAAVLRAVERLGGRIVGHESDGPGGGNPCLHIEVDAARENELRALQRSDLGPYGFATGGAEGQ